MTAYIQARPHLVPCLITAAALIYAVGDRPYAVYQVLRVVTTGTAALMVALGAVHRRWWVVWLFGIVLLLFNPLAPVHLRKADWRWLDVTTAVLLVVVGTLFSSGAPRRDE
ncbi:MAG: DUF6804 family protein [Actinomycetota bacterium]